MTRYGFRSGLGGLFHADARKAAALLPEGLTLVESHPGLGVLVVNIFDFDASEVGPYQELVVSLVVLPWAPRGEPLPFSAVFPVLLATNTDASREHAAERWRLPKLDRCLSIEVDLGADSRVVVVRDERQTLLRLRVTGTKLVETRRTYQCFSADTQHLYRVPIEIVGALSEHEDERGHLELGDHPLAATIAPLLDDPIPFCEQCIGTGEERFGELVLHEPRRSAS